MKVLVLAALIVAVTCNNWPISQQDDWPWQVGKKYTYDVESHTLARLEEGPSSGSAYKARFIVRVKQPGRLQAKLENPQHTQFNQELQNPRKLSKDLKYEPLKNLDWPFEILVEGGRVDSLSLSPALNLEQGNLLKGLISALQVDLSPYKSVRSSHNYFSKEKAQGQFRKMEADVTGDCETEYNVAPSSAEWRRELPQFAKEDDPMEITKIKNYGNCAHRVAYHFGVPENSIWTGTARAPLEFQLMNRMTESRIVAGKQGPIYKAKTTNTVHVSPHIKGQQKAEVLSKVELNLIAVEQDSEPEWQMPENMRSQKNLLYSLSTETPKQKSSSSHENSSQQHQSTEENTRSEEKSSQEAVQDRVRRSASHKHSREIISINKVIIKKRSDESSASSSSSSSSSDSSSAYVNDDIPDINQPAYAALNFNPEPKNDNKHSPMAAQKLVQEISQVLQNSNNLPKGDALSKFNILVRIIASMSTQQLSLTSRNIEAAKSSNSNIRNDMWMVYRDAVTEAGTMPAFQQVKSWILSKKIQEEEAAEVMVVLSTTLRYPTKQLMTEFFNLAMSPEVRNQPRLNSTAIIAAATFINLGHVNNDTAHNFYPTHLYGRLTRKHDRFVLESILPRLSSELKQAIQQGDSAKALVFMKAIGNLAHREILEVFAPYLDGRIQVSAYLRSKFVENLANLANEDDHQARSVLFNILKNTAENYEVRLAALDGINLSYPTAAMVQEMAQMTHNDPSVRVRAAIKASIEEASEFNYPRLFKNARNAKEIMTKDDLSQYLSGRKYNLYSDTEKQLNVIDILSFTGSEDHIWPKSIKSTWRYGVEGFNRKNSFAASFSSVRRFVEALGEQMNINKNKQSGPQPEPNHKFSSEQIAQMLNTKWDNQSPLEAAIHIEYMNQNRYLAYDENDLQKMRPIIQKALADLVKGVDFHYTKIFNQASVSIMFPLAMGVPFIYKFKEPTLLHVQGKAKGSAQFLNQQDYSASIENEMQLTYSRHIDGDVGFLDTLSNQHASAGVVSKFQLNLPFKMQMQMKLGQAKIHIQPLQPEQDTTIAHYSVWPYTANQKKDSHVTISQDATTKVISRRNKSNSIDTKIGQASTGTLFQLQGYSYSKDFRNPATMYQAEDLASNMAFALYQKDLALTHYNFRYLGKQSQSKGVTITAVFEEQQQTMKQSQSSEIKSASDMKDTSPDSSARRQEMHNKVSSGIKMSHSYVVDLSATFQGAQKSEYVLTAAVAQSPIDDKTQYALFAGRNSDKSGNIQMNAFGKVVQPASSSLNFQDALKQEMKTTFETDIKFGQSENAKIRIDGYAERTSKYVEALQKHPLAEEAAKQISQNNLYQPESQQMNVMAHAPDYFKASVSYKDVSPAVKNMTFQAYRLAKHLGFWYTEENALRNAADGKADVEIQMNYMDRTLNAMVTSRAGDLRVRDVPIHRVTVAALSSYSPLKTHERIANRFSNDQFLPYCAVDGNKIKTFSNRIYDYTLSRSWHVVMSAQQPQQDAQRAPNNKHLLILARNPSENKKEVYISYRSQSADVEVQMQPAPQGSPSKATVHVKTSANKSSEGDLTMYWNQNDESPLLQYYTQPDGVVMLNIDEEFRAMFDGQRLVIYKDKSFRNNTRGICGRMSGEPRDDYLTAYGIVDSADQYAASFSLDDENADPKTSELKKLAKQQAYAPKLEFTTILRADSEWQKARPASSSSSEEDEQQKLGSQNVYRVRNYNKEQKQCELEEQVQYYENHGEICITTTPMPSCTTRCKGEDYKEMAAQVVCRPKIDEQFRSFRDQIRRGMNPQVAGVTKPRQFRVPSSCTA